MQTKIAATTKQATLIASKNEGWGFRGTSQSNLKITNAEADALFDRAVRATATLLKISTDAARRFLDSKLGRHIADSLNETEIETRLGQIYSSWKRDVRQFKKMAVNSTDEAFYC